MASRVDLRTIVGLDLTSRERLLADIADAVFAAWSAAARSTLGASADRYLRGLTIEGPEGDVVSVSLEGIVPNILEQGMGPGGVGTTGTYDIRDFVLKPGTSRLRYGKGGPGAASGWYVNIPFRHSAEEIRTLGGQALLRRVRQLAPTASGPFGFRDRPENFVDPRHRAFLTVNAATGREGYGGRLQGPGVPDLLQGLVRFGKVYSEASRAGAAQGQAFAMTWRRMSRKKPPFQAWTVHGGIQARRIAEKIEGTIPQIIGAAFGQSAFGGAG